MWHWKWKHFCLCLLRWSQHWDNCDRNVWMKIMWRRKETEIQSNYWERYLSRLLPTWSFPLQPKINLSADSSAHPVSTETLSDLWFPWQQFDDLLFLHSWDRSSDACRLKGCIPPAYLLFCCSSPKKHRQEKHNNNNNTTSLLQQRPTNNTNTNKNAFVFLLIPLWRLLISVLLILSCFRWCCSSPLSDFLLLSVWLQVSHPDLLLIFLQVSLFLLPNILPLCFVFGNIFFLGWFCPSGNFTCFFYASLLPLFTAHPVCVLLLCACFDVIWPPANLSFAFCIVQCLGLWFFHLQVVFGWIWI